MIKLGVWGKIFLINIYKVLVRSVMNYANVISAACTNQVAKDFEVLQNTALRVIFKKSLLDKVSAEQLREWAEIESIYERHENLLNDYYGKVIIKGNSLLEDLFESFKNFKRRNLLDEKVAVGPTGDVDLEKLAQIRDQNWVFLNNEIHQTTLCRAKWVIKEFLIGRFGYGPVGSDIRYSRRKLPIFHLTQSM